MITKLQNWSSRVRLAHCKRAIGEPAVIGGLSVTPAAMLRLTNSGVAVSTLSAEAFSDGVVKPSWNVPLEETRGIDVAEMWQRSKDIKKKMSEGFSKDKALYDSPSASSNTSAL